MTTKIENVRKIEENTFEIQSHSNKSVWYKINLEKNSCSCPHWRFRLASYGGTCKHYDDLMKYFEDIKDNRQDKFNEIMNIVRENPFIDVMEITEKYGDEIVDEMVQLGMLLENKGKLRVLE